MATRMTLTVYHPTHIPDHVFVDSKFSKFWKFLKTRSHNRRSGKGPRLKFALVSHGARARDGDEGVHEPQKTL